MSALRSLLVTLSTCCASLSVACSDSGSGDADDAGSQDAGAEVRDGFAIDGDPDGGFTGDLRTCEGAAASKSYVGCEYWPTVVANVVWSTFDFAVVVANAGADPADLTITGPGGFTTSVNVPAGELRKVYLPWVPELKGPDSDACGNVVAIPASVAAKKSAYHLTSSRPVTVYQFNALEFKPEGGPASKDWSTCPGTHAPAECSPSSCFSYSNDASLLLPTSALTGHYRITGQHGWSRLPEKGGKNVLGPYFAVTATADGTDVTVKVGAKGSVVASSGGEIVATAAGGVLSFHLDAGDVAQVLAPANSDSDLSGSIVEATKPVQVITGIPCTENPIGIKACDHQEETVFPAESLGKHYVVTQPTGPSGALNGHLVRIYGNVDGTKLAYAPTAPPGAPTTIGAGEVVELGVVKGDFEVTGDQPFAIGSFMLGGDLVDPTGLLGDPSQSLATAVEQWRTRYIFLAPDDYTESWADVTLPTGTTLTLDGAPVTTPTTALTSDYSVTRIKLGAGKGGAHVLVSTKPVGLQVLGYGEYTSYHYPGGLNLNEIAPPPPSIIK